MESRAGSTKEVLDEPRGDRRFFFFLHKVIVFNSAILSALVK